MVLDMGRGRLGSSQEWGVGRRWNRAGSGGWRWKKGEQTWRVWSGGGTGSSLEGEQVWVVVCWGEIMGALKHRC